MHFKLDIRTCNRRPSGSLPRRKNKTCRREFISAGRWRLCDVLVTDQDLHI
jgi:hypothetical protein